MEQAINAGRLFTRDGTGASVDDSIKPLQIKEFCRRKPWGQEKERQRAAARLFNATTGESTAYQQLYPRARRLLDICPPPKSAACPGAIGDKEADKLERCIFDLLTGRCFPNAHYDGGYVEIGGVPAAISRSLYMTAYSVTGLKDRADRMTPEEIAAAGQGAARTRWLLAHVDDPEPEG